MEEKEKETFIITFKECDDDKDKKEYRDDIIISGGVIIDSDIYVKGGLLFVEVETDDKKEFIKKFRDTFSYEFSNIK